MTTTATTLAAATHGFQVAVETSEDRRNRNETGWSPTPTTHNASSPLFLAERAGIPKLLESTVPPSNCPTGQEEQGLRGHGCTEPLALSLSLSVTFVSISRLNSFIRKNPIAILMRDDSGNQEFRYPLGHWIDCGS